jgi:hypothetical protein
MKGHKSKVHQQSFASIIIGVCFQAVRVGTKSRTFEGALRLKPSKRAWKVCLVSQLEYNPGRGEEHVTSLQLHGRRISQIRNQREEGRKYNTRSPNVGCFFVKDHMALHLRTALSTAVSAFSWNLSF